MAGGLAGRGEETTTTIDHVVVLALENRSFDHVLGYLDHPNPAFDGLRTPGTHSNPGWDGAPPVDATPGAKPVLPVGPDHAHDAVMAQLGITAAHPPWTPTNQGFVRDYERAGRRIPISARWSGVVGLMLNLLERRKTSSQPVVTGRGPLIMLSQAPDSVPVLSRLALEFAVCTRWFASVPGETWPNRNFLHAASSDGEVDIDTRLYENPTIFELLERNGRSWRIYHDDTPQVWAFHELWDTEDRHARWFPFTEFAKHVAAGDLPTYSFIEPNHRPPFHTPDYEPVVGAPDISNNQHPENNLVDDAAYDSFAATDTDFARADMLLAHVYESLRANPELFGRTLLLVTYDEHGGFYDHVLPPVGVPNPHAHPDLGTRLLHLLLHRRARAFDFTMLGVRVPAVVISPRIPRGTVDSHVRDHASVPSTLRALFAPAAPPLTARDAWSPPFHGVVTLNQPRDDLPDLSAFAAPPPPRPPVPPEPVGAENVPAYYDNFVKLADEVHKRLVKVGEEETVTEQRPPLDPAQRAATVSQVFADAAHRHRTEGYGNTAVTTRQSRRPFPG
jgi:phospholipase C